MLNFQRLTPADREAYNRILFACGERGCEYSFANLFLWGHQKVALFPENAAIFSHFQGRSVYPCPIGPGDRKPLIEAILQDARDRGIPCRITGITEADKAELEALFPGIFLFCHNRDFFDYVYDINDLADLRGRKFQSKRNHFNRFCADHPEHQVVPITHALMPRVKEFVEGWYARRQAQDPQGDFLLEHLAMGRTFQHWEEIGMEGIAIMDAGQILALTLASRLSEDTFDVHFEKALDTVPGAYNAVNCQFARYLRLKYPEVKYLNREDDMGLEGLRTAKLSYRPHHMVEKYWAYVREELHED